MPVSYLKRRHRRRKTASLNCVCEINHHMCVNTTHDCICDKVKNNSLCKSSKHVCICQTDKSCKCMPKYRHNSTTCRAKSSYVGENIHFCICHIDHKLCRAIIHDCICLKKCDEMTQCIYYTKSSVSVGCIRFLRAIFG